MALLTFFLIVPVHKIIHTLFYPGGLRSKDTVIGLWIEMGVFYAYNPCILKRNRLLLFLITPFIVLSVIPTVGMLLLNFKNCFLMFIILIHAFCSSGDIFNCILVFSQVPKNGSLVNSGGGKHTGR